MSTPNKPEKQESRFSRPKNSFMNTGKSQLGDQKNSLANASGRFLLSVRNRKAAPKGK